MSTQKPDLTDAEFDKLVAGLGGNTREVETSWPDPIDWDLSPICKGKVLELEDCRIGERAARRLSVETAGGVFSLWESTSLSKMFNSVKPGDVILVKFTGMKPLPGGREQRQFRVVVKPGRV